MTATRIAFGILVLVLGVVYLLVKLDVFDAAVLRLVVPLAVVLLGAAILFFAWKSWRSLGGK